MAATSTAKRSTAKKSTSTRTATGTRRGRRPIQPMTPDVRSAALAAMATFESALGEADGFEGATTRNGKNGVLMKAVKLNGHRAVIRIAYR